MSVERFRDLQSIDFVRNRVLKEIPKSREAAFVLELVLKEEKSRRADQARISADVFILPQIAGEGAVVPSCLCDPVLVRGQVSAKLNLHQHQFCISELSKHFDVLPGHWLAVLIFVKSMSQKHVFGVPVNAVKFVDDRHFLRINRCVSSGLKSCLNNL